MNLLVLGGSRFMGLAVVEHARLRGWRVSAFNRGLSGRVPGAQTYVGDRTRSADVRRLADAGPWDAVVDLSGYVPANVLSVAKELAPVCGAYVFVSTVSVYAGWPVEPLSEASEVLDCPIDAAADYGPDDIEDGPTRYGRLKAGCEQAARAVFGDHGVLVVRPGVVLGPHEYVGRLPWWLRRVAAGGTVLAPGDPDRAIQPIDVRDVAEFIVAALATGRAGTFNLAAPFGHGTFGDLLAACKNATQSDAEFAWIPDSRLIAAGVRQWSELPLWRTHSGVWQVNPAKAVAAGLQCRALAQTVHDTWDWLSSTNGTATNDRSIDIGLSAVREREILRNLS